MSRRRTAVRLAVAAGLLVGLAVAAAAVGAWWLDRQWHRPWPQGDTGRELTVEIAPGASGSAILRQLEQAGAIESARISRLQLVHWMGDPPLQAGEYRIQLPASSRDVLAKLVAGDVLTHPVTLVEGLTMRETAERLADEGFADLDQLLAEMADPARIADLDPAATSLEGYLYPDTYAFPRGVSASRVVDALVENFRRRLADLPTPQPPRPLREIVILASIVEKEARLEEERPTIAGVYANRLEIGMALYADPTIIYGLKLAGTWDGNLRRRDLEMDSPYNTYRVAGLPPTPICSPRFSSLAAAARPADVPYLYFVSRNDGSHVFARTLGEHNRNVAVWQKQYWQRRWREEREKASRDASQPGSKPPPGAPLPL
ncbi:MAG: endolytic transglycosylase MltG [Acidobacteria bacterium]|nr:MAG: endolytic transglycosylase MltG [Acidobacteriota bacterium]REK05633.1 MAG: endolytic transglycosylase MltG [Acidobacteriota bacterium]